MHTWYFGARRDTSQDAARREELNGGLASHNIACAARGVRDTVMEFSVWWYCIIDNRHHIKSIVINIVGTYFENSPKIEAPRFGSAGSIKKALGKNESSHNRPTLVESYARSGCPEPMQGRTKQFEQRSRDFLRNYVCLKLLTCIYVTRIPVQITLPTLTQLTPDFETAPGDRGRSDHPRRIGHRTYAVAWVCPTRVEEAYMRHDK